MLWISLLACTPSAPEEMPTNNTDDWVCEESCGTVWTGEQYVMCDSCITDDDLNKEMKLIDEALNRMWNESYMQDIFPLDYDEVRAHAADAFIEEPKKRRARQAALNRVIQGFRNGHSAIYRSSGTCEAGGGADPSTTHYQSCLQPSGDSFVVTSPSTSLGLEPGDLITHVNGVGGLALDDWIMSGPLCTSGAENDTTNHQFAAASLMAVLQKGDVLTVLGLDGEVRTVVAPKQKETLSCRTQQSGWIRSELTEEGIAVFTLSRFVLYQGEPGYINASTDAEFEQYIENMVAQAEEKFNELKGDAVGIVWDIRGNIGGASRVGFEIVAGMPGAKSTFIAECQQRIPDTDPVDYWQTGLVYTIEPDDRFGFDGPVAMLTDGHSVSAADYFALATKTATNTRLFGRPTNGAFGGGAAGAPLKKNPDYYLAVDGARCNDASGTPLETRSVEPHEWVDLSPADAAKGEDSAMKAAVSWIVDQ